MTATAALTLAEVNKKIAELAGKALAGLPFAADRLVHIVVPRPTVSAIVGRDVFAFHAFRPMCGRAEVQEGRLRKFRSKLAK